MPLEGEPTLLKRAAEGDEAAIASIVSWYGPALTRFVDSIVGEALSAEEIAQDSFLRAFEKLDRLRTTERFSNWLWSIARCSALDALRRHRSRTEGHVTTDVVLEHRPSTDAPADLWMERESLAERTRQAVSGLSGDAREILELRYAQQMSYDEISQKLGLTPMQVKARLARARKKARSKLEFIVDDWKRILNELS